MSGVKRKIVAVIEARMGSSRLPGKVMMQVLGKPMLGYLLERVKRSALIDEVVVATSVDKSNDVIHHFCQDEGIRCFRGSEEDVLERILGALKVSEATIGVQIFGDCPLIDVALVDSMIQLYLEKEGLVDFVGSDLETTFPPGTETEVYSVEALLKASLLCNSPEIREHGTLCLRQDPKRFRLHSVRAPQALHYPDLEIELDTQEDFQVIQLILEHFYPVKKDFSIYDIVDYLKAHPEIVAINQSVPRRWKEFREEERAVQG